MAQFNALLLFYDDYLDLRLVADRLFQLMTTSCTWCSESSLRRLTLL